MLVRVQPEPPPRIARQKPSYKSDIKCVSKAERLNHRLAEGHTQSLVRFSEKKNVVIAGGPTGVKPDEISTLWEETSPPER